MKAPKIVVPDQKVKIGVPGTEGSWRHKETIDISCTANFVTDQEIWPQNDSDTLNKYQVPGSDENK